jgi:cell division protein FtsB
MKKLLAAVVASAFAFGTVSTFAANTAAQPQGVQHAVAQKSDKNASVHKVKKSKKHHAKRHSKKAARAA